MLALCSQWCEHDTNSGLHHSYLQIVSAENLVGYSEAAKCQAIAKVFDDAYKVTSLRFQRRIWLMHIWPSGKAT